MRARRKSRLPITPIVVKRSEERPWPKKEETFYVLSSDGLFLCRNHPFFRSSVPARRWPVELAPQEAFLDPKFPTIPKRLFEQIVGFFSHVGDVHGAEAAVILVWDRDRRRVGVLVPEQEAEVLVGSFGKPIPSNVRYFPPVDLPPHLVPLGDVHSHVEYAAYSSATDQHDEAFGAGLHIVVGRIDREPPDLHIEAVVDGERFPLEQDEVIGGYERRRDDFPEGWLEKVKVIRRSWSSRGSWGQAGNGRSGA